MASKNQLLGSGIDYEALARQISAKDEVQKFAPAWRYHETCPEGRVIKTDKALEKLDKAGWVDHPGKVRLLPGFESLFEEEKVEDDSSLLSAFTDKGKRSKIDHSGKED